MDRKGQLTIFLILVVIILFITFFFGYTKYFIGDDREASIAKNLNIPEKTLEIKTYIESCISLESKTLIDAMAKKGGNLNPNSGIYYNDKEMTVFCAEEKNKGCINKLVLRQDLESELSKNLKASLLNCIDFTRFQDQGFAITTGELNLSSTIRPYDVLISAIYPLKFSLGELEINMEKFSRVIDFPLGELYGLAVDITNNEIDKGSFDKDEWMVRHGTEITIEKHRPYPNIAYVLTKKDVVKNEEFLFQFAVKGLDTAGREVIRKPVSSSGCCTNSLDNFCFKNVPEDKCDGTYDEDRSCSCDAITKSNIEGCCLIGGFFCRPTSQEECLSYDPGESEFLDGDLSCANPNCENNNCPSTYIYPDQAFTGPPKKHGESWCVYDGPTGSGFDYVGTRHYLHSCVNGEEIVEECRDFREELCAEESADGDFTRAKCRLNRWYDCGLQEDENSCLDTTFRDCFWLEDRVLNRNTRCVPFVPPGFKFWEGNGQDTCTFANEDPTQDIRLYRQLSWTQSSLQFCQRMGDCGNYRNLADELTLFGYFNPLREPEDWAYLDPGQTDKGNYFVINLPIDSNLLSDSAAIPKGPYGSYASCNIWRAPTISGNCEQCGQDKFKPCTEYKCKSLGQNCVFRIENKRPACIRAESGDLLKPIIEFNETALTPGFQVEISQNNYYDAMEHNISPKINPYEPFTFEITTSKPSRCVLNLRPPNLPIALWNNNPILASLPKLWFSSNFQSSHKINLSFPDKSLNNLKQYLLFVSCTDTLGKENKDGFFLNIGMQDPPFHVSLKIIGTDPKPDQLAVNTEMTDIEMYLNKPFKECRYSKNNEIYESMTKLDCNATVQDIRYIPGIPFGSFVCSSKIKLNVSQFYFNCKDWGNNNIQENLEFKIS